MPKLDFHAYAAQLAKQNGRDTMEPVIEKELLHYEILRAMEEKGLLESLVFQGGTCLRLCYGASRYSDLFRHRNNSDYSDVLVIPTFAKEPVRAQVRLKKVGITIMLALAA